MGAEGGGGGQGAGQGGVEGAEAVSLAGPLGVAEEGGEREDQVGQGRRRAAGRPRERRSRGRRGRAPRLAGAGGAARRRRRAGAPPPEPPGLAVRPPSSGHLAGPRGRRRGRRRPVRRCPVRRRPVAVVRVAVVGVVVVGEAAVVGWRAAAVALVAGAVGPAQAGAVGARPGASFVEGLVQAIVAVAFAVGVAGRGRRGRAARRRSDPRPRSR